MIQAYIAEDEQPALKRLESFLAEYDDIQVVGRSASGEEAAFEIDDLKPDLLFLDIHLADITGIDTLNMITHKPQVIFTTAYDQYAIKAFDLQAVDYLLKPYSKERFAEAIQKARQRIDETRKYFDQIQKLIKNWNPEKEYLRRIPSKIGDRVFVFPDDDVVYFNCEDKLVFAHLIADKFMVNYTLDALGKRLDPEKFFRIHRSTIVNLNYVKTIETWFAGTYKMKVKDRDKTELTISRAAGRKLRAKLGW